jgi:hypothetical protein
MGKILSCSCGRQHETQSETYNIKCSCGAVIVSWNPSPEGYVNALRRENERLRNQLELVQPNFGGKEK